MAKVIDIKSRASATAEGKTPEQVRVFLENVHGVHHLSRSTIARNLVAREPWVVPSIASIERVMCDATLETHRMPTANDPAWDAAYDLRELAAEVYCYACDKRDGFRHE
jgi:hypothetical protein